VASAVAGAVVACVLVLFPADSASAHDYLVESTPAADSVQTETLAQVSLTFNDRVLDLTGDGSSALLQVTDSANRHFETGCATIQDRTVTAPVALGAAGTYTVEWQIVSADGHTVSNAISFRYEPPADATPAPGSASRPTCGSASAGQASTAVPSSEPTGEADSSGLGLVVGIAVAIVVLALVGVVLVVVSSRRRGTRAPRDEDAAGP
jgi:copper resistance protein C